jgi:hypothetical protein
MLSLFGIYMFLRGTTGKSDLIAEGKGLKAMVNRSHGDWGFHLIEECQRAGTEPLQKSGRNGERRCSKKTSVLRGV